MPVSYPKNSSEQLEWWKRRIQHATDFYRPFFGASQVLLDQYNMQAATERERDLICEIDFSNSENRKCDVVMKINELENEPRSLE